MKMKIILIVLAFIFSSAFLFSSVRLDTLIFFVFINTAFFFVIGYLYDSELNQITNKVFYTLFCLSFLHLILFQGFSLLFTQTYMNSFYSFLKWHVYYGHLSILFIVELFYLSTILKNRLNVFVAILFFMTSFCFSVFTTYPIVETTSLACGGDIFIPGYIDNSKFKNKITGTIYSRNELEEKHFRCGYLPWYIKRMQTTYTKTKSSLSFFQSQNVSRPKKYFWGNLGPIYQ